MNNRAYARSMEAKLEKRPLGYTIDGAVDASGVGRTKIYDALRTGQLRARKCGRRTLILEDDLRAFLDALPPYTGSAEAA